MSGAGSLDNANPYAAPESAVEIKVLVPRPFRWLFVLLMLIAAFGGVGIFLTAIGCVLMVARVRELGYSDVLSNPLTLRFCLFGYGSLLLTMGFIFLFRRNSVSWLAASVVMIAFVL